MYCYISIKYQLHRLVMHNILGSKYVEYTNEFRLFFKYIYSITTTINLKISIDKENNIFSIFAAKQKLEGLVFFCFQSFTALY